MSKRPSSPPSSAKRTKIKHDLSTSPPPPPPPNAPHRVERIPLPASLNVNRISARHLAHLTSERIDLLRAQGRHVVGLPLLLNDGIVLDWVRHKSRSLPPKVDHGHEMLAGGGSGTSAADAIIIDSDDDTGSSSSRGLHINHGPSLSQNKSDHPDSQPSPLHPVFNVEDDPPAGVTPSHLPPSRASTSAAGSSSHPFNAADVTSSDSEVDGAEDMDGTENVTGCTTFARRPKMPSLSSLQSIRKSLAGGKRRGSPERDVSPERTIPAPGASQKQGRRDFPDQVPAITSSESEEELGSRASDPQLKRVPLPKTDHGRARRLLMPDSADLPLVAVTMRGDCHFIHRKKKFRISGYSIPNPGVFRHVEDVCMVGNTAVLGCDKGTHQVSFLSVTGKPQMVDVTWSPHSSGPRYQDTQKRGVNRLAAVHAENGHIKFLSGGYDGTIHEWTADIEKLDEPRSRKIVTHSTCIMALAYRDRDRSVMASAQKRLHITDLNRCKTMSHPFSNDIQQIHTHPLATYVTVLEVRHLDRQIQLYDSREGDFSTEPCLSFGQRSRSGKFSGWHTRGSVHLAHFAMTSEDGGVLLWDFRNSKLCPPKKAVIERRFQQTEKVVHTIFADRDIATFGQSVVTFFEDYLAR